jgi:hypothetical protein
LPKSRYIRRKDKELNLALIEGEKSIDLTLTLRKEEWDALKRLGVGWFGKDGNDYSLSVPRLIEEFKLQLVCPPSAGGRTQTIRIRKKDYEFLSIIKKVEGLSSEAEALRSLIYSSAEAPMALFLRPQDLPEEVRKDFVVRGDVSNFISRVCEPDFTLSDEEMVAVYNNIRKHIRTRK